MSSIFLQSKISPMGHRQKLAHAYYAVKIFRQFEILNIEKIDITVGKSIKKVIWGQNLL